MVKSVAIACQGGGSHTAFTAGALKRILEEKDGRFNIVAFTGTSGGTECALLAWYGLLTAEINGVLQEALEEEMNNTLGYSKYDYTDKNTDNSRNGHTRKTVKSQFGKIELDIPRDAEGEHESPKRIV